MQKTFVFLMFLLLLTALLYAETEEVQNSRINAAQIVLERMFAGDLTVSKLIGWEKLKLYNVSFAEDYTRLVSEKDRKTFRDTLITGFADRCRQHSVYPDRLENWTYYQTDDSGYEVTADVGWDYFEMYFSKVGEQYLLTDVHILYVDFEY